MFSLFSISKTSRTSTDNSKLIELPQTLYDSLSMVNQSPVSFSTGFEQIDKNLKYRGLPSWGIIEIVGTPASGKTTLALHLTAVLQKQKRCFAYFDVDRSLTEKQAALLGIETDKLLYIRPHSAEEAWNMVEGLVESHAVQGIVIDSLASLLPLQEIHTPLELIRPGALARVTNIAMKRLLPKLEKHHAHLICVNQYRHSWRKNEVQQQLEEHRFSAGGHALEYLTHVRFHLHVSTASQSISQSTKDVNQEKRGPKKYTLCLEEKNGSLSEEHVWNHHPVTHM